MTNTAHTVTCLLVRNQNTGKQVHIAGFLIGEDDDIVTVAQAIISKVEPYQEISSKKANIIQRYDLPVTFW